MTKPETTMTPQTSTEPVEAPTRQSIRDRIFAAKSRSMTIDFFGTNIELRQPKMGDVLAMRRGESNLDAAQMMLVHYAYIPGTDEKVFEETDIDSLDQLPFGEDMTRFSEAVADLMGQGGKELEVQIADATKSTGE